MKRIDLNCDLGENFGHYQFFDDEQILPYVSSVNVACGYHAGDALTMKKTVSLAKKYNVAIGAHPALPDLEGFGRRKMDISTTEAYAYVLHQIGGLSAFCIAENVALNHVKAHGALYTMASQNKDLAMAIAQAVVDFDKSLILVAASGSELARAGLKLGLKVAREVFADRAYTDEGCLVPRREKGALLRGDALLQQCLSLAKNGEVSSISGKRIKLEADTICLHGDNQAAIDHAINIKRLLSSHQIEIASLGKSSYESG